MERLRLLFLSSLLTLSLLVGVLPRASADPIDDVVRAEMERRHIPGLSIAVVKDGKPVKEAGYGFANLEWKAPATPDTVYELASVTKQFTATAVMMLVEAGQVSLDDPINKYLSDSPAAWKPVTVRHLLNHTSGIKSYTSVAGFEKMVRTDFKPKELLALVDKEPLEFTPGSKWNYSNTGYYLLGLLIEKVSGKSYGDFMQERIFGPLGMAATRVNDFREVIPNRASGYSVGPLGPMNCEYVSPTQPFAAGALVSTVRDMEKWDAALNTEKLVKKTTLAQMWTPTKLSDGKTQDYGFGWTVGERKGHRMVSHSGGIPGFSTDILRLPEDRLTVIILSNSDSANVEAIAQKIAATLVPTLAPEDKKAITDPEPDLTKRLRKIVEGLAKSEADPKDFTEEFWKFLYPDHLKEGKEMLGSIGPLTQFTLTGRTETGKSRQLTYQALFGTTTLNVLVNVNGDGKIAGIGFRPE